MAVACYIKTKNNQDVIYVINKGRVWKNDQSMNGFVFVGGIPEDPQTNKVETGLVARVNEIPEVDDRLLFLPPASKQGWKRLDPKKILIFEDFIMTFYQVYELTHPIYEVRKYNTENLERYVFSV